MWWLGRGHGNGFFCDRPRKRIAGASNAVNVRLLRRKKGAGKRAPALRFGLTMWHTVSASALALAPSTWGLPK
jgi:hypothetical protein